MENTVKNFEYEIYVPLSNNQGQKFPQETLDKFKGQLIHQFGGMTDLKHKTEGVWKVRGIKYFDEIVIWRVLGQDADTDLEFPRHLKSAMMKELKQESILIVKRLIEVV